MDTEYAFTTITAIEAYYEYYEVSMLASSSAFSSTRKSLL